MRILKILNSNDGGGVLQCEVQFINYWKQNGVDVEVLIIGDGASKELYEGLVDVKYFLPAIELISDTNKSLREFRNLFKIVGYSKKIKPLVNQLPLNNYDAIIYCRHYYTGIAQEISKRVKAKLYWYMPLSAENQFERVYYRHMTRKHKIIPIGMSKYSSKSIGDVSKYFVYPGFDESRVSVPGTKPLYKTSINIPDNEVIWGIAARIKQRKAQHLAIEAFIRLLEDQKDIHLVIAGGPLDTSYAKHCINLASNYSENIHFIGQIDNLPEFYASIDLFINSRLDAEPFGISVAEALGSGLPVVAYKQGGPSEMIIPNQNGWLIDKPTVESYYESFSKAFNQRGIWKQMGENAKHSSKKLQSNNNAQKFIDIIKEEEGNDV